MQSGPHHADSVTPNHARHRNGITGRTMTAAISYVFFHPMPRYAIQAAIGTTRVASYRSEPRRVGAGRVRES